jgi:hypothetical protein
MYTHPHAVVIAAKSSSVHLAAELRIWGTYFDAPADGMETSGHSPASFLVSQFPSLLLAMGLSVLSSVIMVISCTHVPTFQCLHYWKAVNGFVANFNGLYVAVQWCGSFGLPNVVLNLSTHFWTETDFIFWKWNVHHEEDRRCTHDTGLKTLAVINYIDTESEKIGFQLWHTHVLSEEKDI